VREPGQESSPDPAFVAGRVATNGNGAMGVATRNAYPRISQATGLVVVSMILTIVFDIPVWIVTLPDTEENRSFAMEIARSLSVGLVIWWGFLRTGRPFRDVFPLKPIRATRLVPLVLMLLGAVILAAEVNFVVQMVWPKPASMKEAARGLLDGSVWVTFLAVVVRAPLTEEFLFRGVILQGFLRNYSRRKAITVSAFLFALFHLNPWQFPVTFLLGVVLGWWLAVSGSLLPCIFGHALANSLPLLISVVGGTESVILLHPVPPGPFGSLQVFWA
jgi:hypothetical protein